MMTQERFIRINNRWVETGEIQRLGHITFSVYVILVERMMNDGSVLVTLKYVLDTLGVSKRTTQTVNKIKEALVVLQERGHITAVTSFVTNDVSEMSDSIQINDLLYLYVEVPKRFIMMKTQELNTILQLEDAEKKRALLAYFSSILFHINTTTKACYPLLETLKREARISNDSTCIAYNKELEELGLITYKNVGVKARQNGKHRQGMNVYARPEHLEQLEEEVKRLQERDKYYFVSEQVNSLVNQQRSVKQKLNKLLKNREYENLSVEEQRKVDELNARYEKLQSEHKQIKKEHEELKKKHRRGNSNHVGAITQVKEKPQLMDYEFDDRGSSGKSRDFAYDITQDIGNPISSHRASYLYEEDYGF